MIARLDERLANVGRILDTGRLLLARWLRLQLAAERDYLILSSDRSGMFSDVAMLLGLMEHFDLWRDRYAGLAVEMPTDALYHDSAHGPNWWDYYFEPVQVGHREGARVRHLAPMEKYAFALRAEERMSRHQGHALITRCMRVRTHVVAIVDAFARAEFRSRFVVGVHYRGTDKALEVPRVAYDEVALAVREAMARSGRDDTAVFVATDEQPFLDYMLAAFPAQVIHRDVTRSTDDTATHVMEGDNYRKGEDALVDCLLLARCVHLIRTDSNLGLCASFLNPDIPVQNLTPLRKNAVRWMLSARPLRLRLGAG